MANRVLGVQRNIEYLLSPGVNAIPEHVYTDVFTPVHLSSMTHLAQIWQWTDKLFQVWLSWRKINYRAAIAAACAIEQNPLLLTLKLYHLLWPNLRLLWSGGWQDSVVNWNPFKTFWVVLVANKQNTQTNNTSYKTQLNFPHVGLNNYCKTHRCIDYKTRILYTNELDALHSWNVVWIERPNNHSTVA